MSMLLGEVPVCSVQSIVVYLLGVEYADSVCWDAHKMMGVPLICSAFIIKQPEILRAMSSHGDSAHYLFHEDAESVEA